MTKQLNVKPPSKPLWWSLFAFSTLGLLASFVQTIERINYAKNPQVPLTCDVNAVFSCSNVFDAWQSSVFGFSNSLLCIVFFAFIASAALAGATGSLLHKKLRLALHFFSVFFLCFGAWYLWQSTFSIGYICVFCAACYSGVIGMNWAWLRLNSNDLVTGAAQQKRLTKAINNGLDTFLWLLWAIVVAATIIFHFW